MNIASDVASKETPHCVICFQQFETFDEIQPHLREKHYHELLPDFAKHLHGNCGKEGCRHEHRR